MWLAEKGISEERIDRVAGELKAEYERARRQLRPGYAVDEEKYPLSMWREIAMDVMEAGAQPSAWIDAQFYYIKPYPYVNLLKGPEALARYRSRTVRLTEDIPLDLKLQAETLKVWLSDKNASSLPEILEAPAANFNPLFIWCVALCCGLSDLADRYRERALRMLALNPMYEKIYKRYFPEAFQEASCRPP